MAESFLRTFGQTFVATSEVALVVATAWVLVSRGVISQAVIKGLSDLTILLFLPCLMFSDILGTLRPAEQPLWWLLPVLGLAMFVAGTLIAMVALAGSLRTKRDLIPLAAMQNAAFIVLPVGQALVPEEFDRFALYCFLFLIIYSPLFWSVGKFLNTSSGGRMFSWNSLFSPPLVANLFALALVLTGAKALVPEPVVAATRMLGAATVPAATIVLGGVLGGMQHRFRAHLADAVRSLSVKLLVIPLLTILVLSATSIRQTDPLLALVLVLQGASPPATNIVLQITTYGGNLERSGTIMLMGYIAALVTIPAWVALWQVLG